ncbi:MAG: DUF86 domain-containing protein [Candidatus Omnitrophica bacterium]|nr:DUF86 domain-containing protein [Candidatus Omnitrophota bacterium]
MSKDEVRLRHMLEAARKAVQLAQGRTREALEADETLTLALTRLLEILGEAAKGISEEAKRRTSGIAWKEIAGTRDRLIHGYFDVDLDIIWQIVTKDLPPLIAHLEKLVAE